MVKQVIVVRKDLNMRKGKIASQVAHASMKVFLDKGEIVSYNERGIVKFGLDIGDLTNEMIEWISGSFTKICVYVNSEEELIDVYNLAKSLNIPCSLIIDSGKTEFNGISTKTCCAIGPDTSEKIDKVTGDLKLL